MDIPDFLRVKNIWNLDDLIKYCIELAEEEQENILEYSLLSSHAEVKECLLREIDESALLQQDKKKLSMPNVAYYLEKLSLYLDHEEINELKKILRGDYRRKRGEKADKEQQRRDDKERFMLFWELKEEYGSTEAKSRLASKEKIDERSVERAVNRGYAYFLEEEKVREKNRFYEQLEEIKRMRLKEIRMKLDQMINSQNNGIE